ncbi:hypothetical protein DRE_04885 [Drechslerella stenobrocha 248]|uniref:Nicotinamide-nucleotide adenylyltransferase n=1 Tax=Drechslerella stenobrocha 248 TaxID=1043628 RepID=W7I0W9_9PEZI|nr:hypothetical protein DRE_04885 [Drechslerella stenobrocha 248]
MEEAMLRAAAVRTLLPAFQAAVASPVAGFSLVRSYPEHADTKQQKKRTVCVLDSSVRPSTRLQRRTCTSPCAPCAAPQPPPTRKPTANADKKAAPAAPEQRVAMMCLLAQEIRDQYATSGGGGVHVDVGVTTSARFVDKSDDLRTRGYNGHVLWIVGFDTLVRLLDVKYYPPAHTLAPVTNTLLAGDSRILAFARPDDGFGSASAQQAYCEAIDPAIAGKLDVLDADEATAGVSSSAVRKAVAAGEDGWRAAVCPAIAAFVDAEALYQT